MKTISRLIWSFKNVLLHWKITWLLSRNKCQDIGLIILYMTSCNLITGNSQLIWLNPRHFGNMSMIYLVIAYQGLWNGCLHFVWAWIIMMLDLTKSLFSGNNLPFDLIRITSEGGEVCEEGGFSAIYEFRQTDQSTPPPSLSSIIYGQFAYAAWERSLPVLSGVAVPHSFSGNCRIAALHNVSVWQIFSEMCRSEFSSAWDEKSLCVSLQDTDCIKQTHYSSRGANTANKKILTGWEKNSSILPQKPWVDGLLNGKHKEMNWNLNVSEF